MFELGVTVRMVMQVMRSGRRRNALGAKLQREGMAGGWHEPHGHIGPECERNQQEPGNQVTAAVVEQRSLHKPQGM
jgi:hypothetical protein